MKAVHEVSILSINMCNKKNELKLFRYPLHSTFAFFQKICWERFVHIEFSCMYMIDNGGIYCT